MLRRRLTTLLFFTAWLSAAHADTPKHKQQQAEPLGLDEILKTAVDHDGRVLAAHAQLDVYRAKFKEARWLWFPTTKLDVLFGGPVGERRLACPDRPDCVELRNPSPWNFGDLRVLSFAVGGRLEAGLPLFTFGKLTGAERAAKAGIKAGQAGIQQARQEVALEVRRAYYSWLLATHAVEILEDGQNKLQKAEEKLIKMLDSLNEEVTDRDLFKLRYHAAQVHALRVQTNQGQKMALSALEFLTGLNGLGETQPLKTMPLQASSNKLESRDVYLTQARQKRPELRQLQAVQEAAQAAVDIQKASFYPDFFLAGYLGGSYSPAHDLIENSLLNRGFTYYDAGLSLGLRITLDIPQKSARLDKARADLAKLQAQANQAHQALALEIDKRVQDLKAAEANIKILKKGHRAAKAWMRANFMSYGIGISNTKDLLDSLAAYAQSSLNLYKTHHDMLIAQDALDACLGNDITRIR